MKVFGRGVFYILIGLGLLSLLAILTKSQLAIPWFIILPIILIAFLVASKQDNIDGGDSGGFPEQDSNYDSSGDEE
ncbi:hypothetical protein [Aquibacillus kalidii]|uniref:hypothetical protein n=1 Tax=Aquibacillus kalidii TaxID=2762597 RepID=UPI0016495361|nr:hypothetical protein [Aquibacillus kalidii]